MIGMPHTLKIVDQLTQLKRRHSLLAKYFWALFIGAMTCNFSSIYVQDWEPLWISGAITLGFALLVRVRMLKVSDSYDIYYRYLKNQCECSGSDLIEDFKDSLQGHFAI